jgi:hypothetical protein
VAEKVEHLRQALRLLRAGGLESEAHLVQALVQELLKQKVAELHRLQAEVDSLRQLAAGNHRVKLHLKLMEVPLDEMQAEGIAVKGGRAAMVKYIGLFGSSKSMIAFTTCDDEAVSTFVESLRKRNRANVLAEPTLLVVGGQPCTYGTAGNATCEAGEEPPNESPREGMKVEAHISLLDDEQLLLTVQPTLSRPSESNRVPPALSLFFVEVPDMGHAACTIEPGKCLIINGPIEERTVDGSQHKVQTLLVVTPEIVSTPGQHTAGRASETRVE